MYLTNIIFTFNVKSFSPLCPQMDDKRHAYSFSYENWANKSLDSSHIERHNTIVIRCTNPVSAGHQ